MHATARAALREPLLRVQSAAAAASGATVSLPRVANVSTTRCRTSVTTPSVKRGEMPLGGRSSVRMCIPWQSCQDPTDTSPARRSYNELYESHAKYKKVVAALFPSASIDYLSGLSPEKLVEKAQASLQFSAPPGGEEGALGHIRSLEPSPARSYTWDEVSGDDDDIQQSRVADDVNGLALSLEPLKASYLGFTSIPTILRVIARVSPRVRQVVPMPPTTSRTPEQISGSPEYSGPSRVNEISLINAYFSQIHLITPMVDEMDFRQRYSEVGVSEDQDSSWLSLANMVLAMGCFASDETRFTGNNVYYKRALSHLNISSFGSGDLYTVQALVLYGGYILHYLNKPNMSSAVMGATIRMAVAMGLHRVQLPKNVPTGPQRATESSVVTRIRTWWSIFCSDTWGGATLGRPGTGYWNPAMVLTSPTSSLASFVRKAHLKSPLR